MKIISASRRTDIPAFYSRWFLNRLEAGYCHWRNPYGGQVTRVSLAPDDVLAIVFWTRNPRPLLSHLAELRGRDYPFYFHVTINGYPRTIESHNPPVDAATATFRSISKVVGPTAVHWRYDPIVLSDATPLEEHIARFDRISAALAGYTERCYFSFVDMYGKTARNLARVEREHGLTITQPDLAEQRELVRELQRIASARGITLYACCEADLVGEGARDVHEETIGMPVQSSACIDTDTIRALLLRDAMPGSGRGRELAERRLDALDRQRAAPTRQDCGCVQVTDIGAYDTCAFGCTYCYATNSRAVAHRNMQGHDPTDSILLRPPSLRGVNLDERAIRPPAARTARTGAGGEQVMLFTLPERVDHMGNAASTPAIHAD